MAIEICDNDAGEEENLLYNIFTEGGGVTDIGVRTALLFDDAAIATLLMEEELQEIEDHRYFDGGSYPKLELSILDEHLDLGAACYLTNQSF